VRLLWLWTLEVLDVIANVFASGLTSLEMAMIDLLGLLVLYVFNVSGGARPVALDEQALW
jgi:hypothetical protein